MRVLITTDWYKPVINGVVTSVMNLSRQLRERGHEVKILTLSRTFHSYIEGVSSEIVNRSQYMTDPHGNTLLGKVWFMQDQLDLDAFIRRQD